MSKYHPLDVRHPANRDLLSRNFLLEPPAQDRIATSSRARRASAVQAAVQPVSSAPADPLSPWGQDGPARPRQRRAPAQVAPTTAPATAARRRGGALRLWIIVIGVAVFVLSRPGNQSLVSDGVNFVIDFFDDILG